MAETVSINIHRVHHTTILSNTKSVKCIALHNLGKKKAGMQAIKVFPVARNEKVPPTKTITAQLFADSIVSGFRLSVTNSVSSA